MFNPVATYRIQFHKGFTFTDLEQVIPYLKALGVSTIYASPIFRSVPGSMHGYDITDPLQVNPEIGTEEQFRHITQVLEENGMKWIQDIVPNHMAFHHDNAWLMDVLQHGKDSVYATYFDIDWELPSCPGRIMLPVLTTSLEEAVQSGELKIGSYNNTQSLTYKGMIFPLKNNTGDLTHLNDDHAQLIRTMNEQHYHLCYWQDSASAIGYRRFFIVNNLICLNMQHEHVFEKVHQLIKQFVDDGCIVGVRVDHIDGLYDPSAYLQRLRKLVGDQTYIIIEKVLKPGEHLPKSWPIQGTTGYDFLALVNNLLAYLPSEKKFTQYYRKLTDSDTPFVRQAFDKKALILFGHMKGELDLLCRLFAELHHDNDISGEETRNAIAQFLIYCPVYRYYGNTLPLDQFESRAVSAILRQVLKEHPRLQRAVAVLRKVLLEQPYENDPGMNQRILHFYKRCMQFTGPLTAKGIEDTMMYTSNRFIGHNEVGDLPSLFGVEQTLFHKLLQNRQRNWPLGMNATSTHDTKRGEDTRARLNVLTAIADEWLNTVEQWKQLNASLKKNNIPDANEEYFIYQSLLGAYPVPGQSVEAFKERFLTLIGKFLREAKVHSNWAAPGEQYETAVKEFATALLDENTTFWKSFQAFHQKVSGFGIINSLVQVVLRFTCPGLPDTYQGSEHWDLSFVDPDNRKPVPFEVNRQLLNEASGKKPKELWQQRSNGEIKLWLVQHLFRLRSQYAKLFEEGQYIPLKTEGTYKDHVLAFARRYKQTWVIVIVPLYLATLCKDEDAGLKFNWKSTTVVLPEEAPAAYTESFSGMTVTTEKNIRVEKIFSEFPAAVLVSAPSKSRRGAGVLMHLTSLSSSYGIGDMGYEARAFADFLARSKQKYWQLLPLNPTKFRNGHSPYSATSGMAGNILLISPDCLIEDGLLEGEDLLYLLQTDKIDFVAVEKLKLQILEKAYARFKSGRFESMQAAFEKFIAKEAYWLEDYALYVVIKQHQQGNDWAQWEDGYKKRDAETISTFAAANEGELAKVKWMQFIFFRQWKLLKEYCNISGVKLIGDLPFYLSYDSADVWAHPDLFTLDENKNITGVAGVPPDYFSKTGQLWGMPTYNWEIIKSHEYDWWITRLKKNFELFDLLRIDHFRAFAEYWEVPAGEQTAERGQWKPGPGKDFFAAVEKALGKLPFVAEDLGDNMQKVYDLRSEVGLPGMKVLQFGFGKNNATAVDAPHNFTPDVVVYTGTHDNNTTLGWYREELTREDRKRMDGYTGIKVNRRNVHLILSRIAYASVADMVILPMQDILGLDASKRMNTPGSAAGNWVWRLLPDQLNKEIEARLRNWVKIYGRA